MKKLIYILILCCCVSCTTTRYVVIRPLDIPCIKCMAALPNYVTNSQDYAYRQSPLYKQIKEASDRAWVSADSLLKLRR